MKPPEELSSVDWSALTHAYGGADDVPDLVRALYTGDEDRVEEALYELYGNVHHQGTVFPATVEAVPFLAHAALHAVLKRDEVLMLLVAMADQTTPADPVTEAVLAAVGAAAPELLSCLEDADPAVRRAALRVAAVATDPKAVVERLTAVYVADPDADVRADALTALARVDPDEAREAAALGDSVRADPAGRRVAAPRTVGAALPRRADRRSRRGRHGAGRGGLHLPRAGQPGRPADHAAHRRRRRRTRRRRPLGGRW